jgi:hypothetical protein
LGKIKCAAKALARVSACSSFNFAKGWHFVCHFSFGLLSVVSSFRVSANGLRLGVVRVFGEGFVGKTNAYLETRTPFYLNARITPSRC